MNRPLHTGSTTGRVMWDIYYTDKHTGNLKCMQRSLPQGMSKESIRQYITRMGHTIDKAISDEIIYTY